MSSITREDKPLAAPAPVSRRSSVWLLLVLSLALHALLLAALPQLEHARQTTPVRVLISVQPAPVLPPLPALPATPPEPAPPPAQVRPTIQPAAPATLPPDSQPVAAQTVTGSPAAAVTIAPDAPAFPAATLDPPTPQPPAAPSAQAPLPGPPPAAPPALPPPAAPALDSQALLQDYAVLVKAQVLAHKRYPPLAERLGHQGEVKIGFTLAADGGIDSLAVKVSSGFTELDAAALAAVEAAEPFALIPAELGRDQLSLTLTLQYRLN